MQLVVQFNNPVVLTFETQPTCKDVKLQLADKEDIPVDLLCLSVNGLSIENGTPISEDCSFIQASLRNTICGGKGGFGGMLKSLAKQKGKTKTTDFGACRDLNGRRLRHINDEILLNKWKNAKDRGQEFDVEEETATGIDLWYLSVPSWADGIKVDKRRRFLKPRLKTVLCLDWLRARQDGVEPPSGAQDFWGCPRGARCEFAHGEKELRGATLKQIQDERSQAKRDDADRKQEDYMGPMYRAEKDDNEVNDLVLAGLRAAKKAKMAEKQGIQKANTVVEATVETAVVIDEPIVDSANVLLKTKGDDVIIDNDSFVVMGNSLFGTVFGPHCGVSIGAWYYEVEILSDGLMQIGWTLKNLSLEVDVVEGDGIGDDSFSWSYDGFRQLMWHNGESSAYGPESGYGWKQGDVVGCYVDFKKGSNGEMWFSLNGELLQKVDCNLLKNVTTTSSGDMSSAIKLFPALSLDKKEKVGVNFGQATFRHYQPLLVSSSSDSVNKYKRYDPLWNAIPSEVLVANGYTDDREILPQDVEDLVVEPVVTAAKKDDPVAVNYDDIQLEAKEYPSVNALEALGMGHLKHELERRGLKAGGTLKERAERLFSVRGIPVDKIDKKLLSKK